MARGGRNLVFLAGTTPFCQKDAFPQAPVPKVDFWRTSPLHPNPALPALALGLACAAVGCGLLFYARAYLHKMKEVGYW